MYNKGNKKDERMSGSIKILIGRQEKRNEKVLFLFSETYKDLTAL